MISKATVESPLWPVDIQKGHLDNHYRAGNDDLWGKGDFAAPISGLDDIIK